MQRVTVRISDFHAWRVWRAGSWHATIKAEKGKYILYDRSGRPIAQSRDWQRVKDWAKQRYTLGY